MFKVILQKKFQACGLISTIPGLWSSGNFINTLYCLYHRFSIVPKFKGKNNFDMYSFVDQIYKIHPDIDVNDF